MTGETTDAGVGERAVKSRVMLPKSVGNATVALDDVTPAEPDAGDVEACCEHSLSWHHERRGCGYHGFAVGGRCPCLLTFDEALAHHDDAVRRKAGGERAEQIAQAIEAAADHGSRVGFGYIGCYTAMMNAARIARRPR